MSKQKKKTSSKGNEKSKKKTVQSKEEKLDVPQTLKILCILSFIGFIFCLVRDTSDYFTYSNVNEFANSSEQAAYEALETRLDTFKKNDIDIGPAGLMRLTLLSTYRTIFDILAMVGTALMYFRIRKGFYIYGAFQLLYVVVPFAMFGIGAMVIYDKLALVPPLIYLLLFTTQFKHLNR